MYDKQFIYEYWSRTELGRAMIKSENISENDLLFLMPNSVKHMHGLPLTRCAKRGRNKRKYKTQRKRQILCYKLWDTLLNIIDDVICSQWKENDFFKDFVDVKECTLGVQNIYEDNKKIKEQENNDNH